jgi:hypothetical protein
LKDTIADVPLKIGKLGLHFVKKEIAEARKLQIHG